MNSPCTSQQFAVMPEQYLAPNEMPNTKPFHGNAHRDAEVAPRQNTRYALHTL